MLEARSLFFIIEKYALELIANIGLASANFISTPMELNLKLTSTKFDHHILSYQKDPLLDNSTGDQRLIERLLYLTTTRPDISFTVQCLSQFMHSLKVSHMNATLRLVRYVKRALDLGIMMSSMEVHVSIVRSITGYLV